MGIQISKRGLLASAAAFAGAGAVAGAAYLFEVKKPSESRGEWDYYKLVQTVPADQAWRPLGEGGCNLVHS